MTEQSDQEILQASDLYTVQCMLRIMQDRARSGVQVRIVRPPYWPKTADPVATMHASMEQMLSEVFDVSAVDEAEEADA